MELMRLRILVFVWRDIHHTERGGAGGATVNIHEQARRWVEWGHQVTMFTARPKGQRSRDNIDGIDIYRAGGRFSVYIWAIAAYLLVLRRHADVILDIENGIPFFTPLYSRKPTVLLMHHLHQDQFLVEMGTRIGKMGRFMERFLVPLLYRSAAIVAVSESTARRKKAALRGGYKLEIKVIYNGLDHSLYVPGMEGCTKPAILYLGRIKRYKRLPRLVAMMPLITESIPDAQLTIAGDGDAAGELREQVARNGLGDAVRIVGMVSDEEKVRLLQMTWVMATPSMNEGWGMTVLEANACGTPAVAFRVAGLDEAIIDGETGFLCDDDKEFAEVLVKVLSDKELRERLSRAAIEWAARFDWDRTAHETLDVLREQSNRKRA